MTEAQEFRKAMRPYFTHEDLVKNSPSDTDVDGNALMYTAIYYIFLAFMEDEPDRSAEVALMELCERWEERPGVLNRGGEAKSTQRQSHDDYIYLLAACFLCGQKDLFPKRVLSWGEENFWYFHNVGDFTFSNWFGRHSGFIPHVKACAGAKLSFWDRFKWSMDVLFTITKPTNATSGRLMDWAKVLVMRERESHWLTNYAMRAYRKKLGEYEGGMKDVFGIYFGFSHPFSKHAQEP